jgi:hypothetical protein
VLTVVTSFTPMCYKEYASRFIVTFDRFWAPAIKLVCYTHDQQIGKHQCVDLPSTEPAKSFLERHRSNLAVRGKKEVPGWRTQARKLGYSIRHDAYVFSRKIFALAHASRHVQGKLFWVDADIITFKDVSEAYLDALLPRNASICHLAKKKKMTETSFLGFDLDKPESRQFIDAFEYQYASDAFMACKHWDDGSQFDYLLNSLTPAASVIPHTYPSFDSSVLAEAMIHLRGVSKYDSEKVRDALNGKRPSRKKR